MKILFLAPYPLNISPSQRFRFEQYFPALIAAGHTYQVQTFLKTKSDVLSGKGNLFSKLGALISGKLRRLYILTRVHEFDRVFIHREAMPIGPPFIEWIIAVAMKKKIIYDFDDAIWLTDRLDEPLWLRMLKWRSKVGTICRWSNNVSAGNEYLSAFANYFGQVTGVDIFTGDPHAGFRGDIYKETQNNLRDFDNITLVRADYKDFIATTNEVYDLAHVDIVHTYEDTYRCGLWSAEHSRCTLFHDTQSFRDVKAAVADIARKTNRKFYNYRACHGLGILI